MNFKHFLGWMRKDHVFERFKTPSLSQTKNNSVTLDQLDEGLSQLS